MKKLILLALSLFIFNTTMNAQQWNGASNSTGSIYRIGNVAIGTSNPQDKLDVRGVVRYGNGTNAIGRLSYGSSVVTLEAASQNTSVWLREKKGSVLGKGIFIKYNGKVGIGTNNPDKKLTVNGTIHCKEVKVDLNVPADYVFEKYYNGTSTLKADYTMPTLEEVAIYTKENNHLPEMPSAQEIKKNGLHLKEMTNLLLQKIEELTLYAIEQEKRINALEAKLVTTTDEVETK